MERNQNSQNWRIVVLWLIALLSITTLTNCGLRKVDKQRFSQKYEADQVDVVKIVDTTEVLTEVEQKVSVVEHTTKTEKTKIYPKGSFSYSDGMFVGEADSVISDKNEDFSSTFELWLRLEQLRKNFNYKADSSARKLSGIVNAEVLKKEPSSSNRLLLVVGFGVLIAMFLVFRTSMK